MQLARFNFKPGQDLFRTVSGLKTRAEIECSFMKMTGITDACVWGGPPLIARGVNEALALLDRSIDQAYEDGFLDIVLIVAGGTHKLPELDDEAPEFHHPTAFSIIRVNPDKVAHIKAALKQKAMEKSWEECPKVTRPRI